MNNDSQPLLLTKPQQLTQYQPPHTVLLYQTNDKLADSINCSSYVRCCAIFISVVALVISFILIIRFNN